MNGQNIGGSQNIFDNLNKCSAASDVDANSHQGLICPRCENDNVVIDSQMNLVCPRCEFMLGGGFT